MKALRLVFLALVIIASGLLVQAQVVHERWPIKTSYHHAPEKPRKMRLTTLLKLKDPVLPEGKKEKDYQSQLLPGSFKKFHEGDFVETTGWLHYILHEGNDDDYHLQISTRSDDGNNCVIVEIPDPVNAPDAQTRQHWSDGRAFIAGLNKGKPAPKGGKRISPVYVRIRGQLFYDLSHSPNETRGRDGMKAGTIWEIHPVWSIERAKYR